MKKAGIVLLLVFALGSCAVTPVMWDDSCPEDRLATVRFFNMHVESYNGIAVSKFAYVKIPAGETRIGADVSILHTGNVYFHTRGMEFTVNLEAGREYTAAGAARDMKWGVVLRDAATKEELAFVPFKNQPVF